MAAQLHTIHSQRLLLSFREGAPASSAALPVMLSAWLHQQLLPAMEAELDALCPPGQRLRLDRLELDAGTIYGPGWEAELCRRVCDQLRRSIRQSPATLPEPPNDPEASAGQDAPKPYTDAEQQSLLLHYLETGSLPWYATHISGTELLQWLEYQLSQGFMEQAAAQALISSNPEALQRLLMQLRQPVLEAWMQRQNPKMYEQLMPAILNTARRILGTGPTAMGWACSLLLELQRPASVSKPLWQLWLQAYNTDPAPFIAPTQQLAAGLLSPEAWSRMLEPVVNRAVADKVQPAQTPGAQPADNKEPEAAAAGSFIGNAGLILLHPFIPAWLRQLGLADRQGMWVDGDAHKRAVLLLHLLATGHTEAAEYELPLCKLLSGYPMNQPVAAHLEPTEPELTEARGLLEQVIAQWPILKSTSPEGLRDSFLVRPGKLSLRENGWLLQVEQRSIDLLLEHLPWGIGVVRNSWMPEILFTEWA